MTDDDRLEALFEAALTPYRERDREGRLMPPPAWWDLAPEQLDELHVRQSEARQLERLLDPEGRSGTVRAVMMRLMGGR